VGCDGVRGTYPSALGAEAVGAELGGERGGGVRVKLRRFCSAMEVLCFSHVALFGKFVCSGLVTENHDGGASRREGRHA